MHILTLITNPATLALDENIINKALMSIERKGAQVENISFLCPGAACDVFFTQMEQARAEEILTSKLSDKLVDFVIQENKPNRRKKLFVSDMDSTIINQECIDEIAAKLGLKEKVSAITERAMNGELDFKSALKERVKLLAGLDETELDDVYENHITLMDGAKTLVQTMKKNEAHCLLVSGGFTFFTEKVAANVGFHGQSANILEIKNGKLTGFVVEPILDKESKLAALNQAVNKLGIANDDTLAAGDGANDLPMLLGAGMGVAYHAKPAVRQQAKARINHAGLKSLLYIQGYKEAEIINA